MLADNGGEYKHVFPLFTECCRLYFEVKANSDALIRLTQSEYPCEKEAAYEIAIGEGDNKYSAIRRLPDTFFQSFAVTNDILCGTEFRGFWIYVMNGVIIVEESGSAKPFLIWKDPDPINVNYFSFCTTEHNGLWRFPDECTCK